MAAEIELKLAIPDAEVAESLRALSELPGFVLDEPRIEEMEDTYLDSRDRRLFDSGWALRLRVGPKGRIAELKAVGGAAASVWTREEFAEAIPEGKDKLTSDLLDGRIEKLCPVRKLRNLATLRQRRQKRDIYSAGRRVGELSVDEVHFGDGVSTWTLEVECADPSFSGILESIGKYFAETWRLLPETSSKFEQALRSLERGAIREREESRLEVIVAAELKSHSKDFKTLLASVAEDRGIEALHDARIAARRLRTLVELMEERIGRKMSLPAIRRLARAGRILGRVRDLDVLLGDLRKRAGSAGHGRLLPFVADIEAERDAGLDKLRSWLDSGNADRLFSSVGSVARLLSKRQEKGPVRPASLDGLSIVADLLAELLAFDSLAREPGVEEAAFHAARRAAKRLRYALEALESLLGPAAAKAVSDLKRLQSRLGAVHDSAVAARKASSWLARRIGPDAPPEHETVPEVARYLAKRQEELGRLLASIPSAWKLIATPGFRRRLVVAFLDRRADATERAETKV